MYVPGGAGRLATLWNLAWDRDRLACRVYRADGQMQLKIESADAVVITESFDLGPRAARIP